MKCRYCGKRGVLVVSDRLKGERYATCRRHKPQRGHVDRGGKPGCRPTMKLTLQEVLAVASEKLGGRRA